MEASAAFIPGLADSIRASGAFIRALEVFTRVSGFHPGFRPGFAGFHPGFHPFFRGRRFVFHRGFFRNGVFINGWWGPALVTSAWWGGYGGCWTYRPVYDAGGAYLGYSYVNLCW